MTPCNNVTRRQVDSGWRFSLGENQSAHKISHDDSAWRTVDLPHDWSIEGPIASTEPTGAAGGFFPSGIAYYRRHLEIPDSWAGHAVTVEFEGVYMNADVWINDTHVATHPYGYTPFYCELSAHLNPGGKNVLVVRVDNSRHLNSRWYTGSGIYRHVWLSVANRVHIAPWGVFVSTPTAISRSAKVVVRVQLDNQGRTPVNATAHMRLVDPDGVEVGAASVEVMCKSDASSDVVGRITVKRPALWSPESPTLYKAQTDIVVEGAVVDRVETLFGIRSIAWSVERGLELNGKTIKLCGGCVHHDHGSLGAASFDRAEERRVQILKAAGFNAIRTSHNPPAPAFLDACDRLGMLVMSELCDGWSEVKNTHDYGVHISDWWRRDLDAMIRSERNHPSIVIWSVGNEMMERFKPAGAAWAARLADHVRLLDTSRPVTAAVCGPWFEGEKWVDSDGLMASLDIGSYNYNLNEHVADHQRVPTRIMACTESYPSAAFEYWAYATDHPYIIGDFVWTAMDYLGEAGIGRWLIGNEAEIVHGHNSLYPWHGAICGDIDICGDRKALSHYRAILWDRGETIFMAVRPPDPAAGAYKATGWAVPLPVASWTWPGSEGVSLQVEVYTKADTVRLFLNDTLLAESPATREQQFKARFTVPYVAGHLSAVAIRAGREIGECSLRTVGEAAAIRLVPDRTKIHAGGADLCFVQVQITDATGEVEPNAKHDLAFTIDGPGVIAGICNATLYGPMNYQGDKVRTSCGRAWVVIRSQDNTGSITLRATADGLTSGEVRVDVV